MLLRSAVASLFILPFWFAALAADTPAGKVQSVGESTEFLVPPKPWTVEEEHTTDTQRYYQWSLGDDGMAEICVFAPHDFADGDRHGKAADIVTGRKDQIGEGEKLLQQPGIATSNGVSRARARFAWGPGYADRTEIYRDLPGNLVMRVDATIYVQNPRSAKAEKAIEATRKLAQDMALSAAPKGKVNTSAALAFDAKAVLARPPGEKHEGIEVGDTPDLKSVNAVNNKSFNLADYRGKVVVVDFWATWCGPCMAEAGHMVELNEKYSSQGVQLVGVSLDNDRKEILEVAKNSNFNWPQVFGGNGWKSPPAVAWGVNSIPCTFVLSPEGEVVWRGHPQTLESAIKMALATYPPHEVKPEAVVKKPAAAQPVEPKPAEAKPAAAEAKPIAPATPAEALAAARKLKTAQPAEAYAAFRAIVKSSAFSAEGKAAQQELAAMESDDAMAKKVMTAEGRAYSAYSMAKNFAATGQAEKAKERFDQIAKDYPDTMCGAMAKKESAGLAGK